MAFVFRGQRKSDLSKPLHPVGPGSYQSAIQKQSKIPKAFVPFGTMQPRSKDINYKDLNLPGPGSYNIAENQTGQKIVVSSETEDIKILEISRPNPVFKSGTQRFKGPKEQQMTPGPGEYNFGKKEGARQKMLSTNTNTTQKPKIIEHLININKYQSIPSIPSNIHAYGYNQNDNNELQLNEPPIEVYKGEKEDKVGPGHYNAVNAKQKLKGTSLWSQAKEKRMEDVKTNTNIGPGSYDAKNVQTLYNYKPSVGFASKTLRTMDQRKGAVINQKNSKIHEKINEDNSSVQSQVQSRVFSDKAPPSTKIDEDSDDDEYEYIDETTPGPGSYLQISDVKKSKLTRPTPGFGVNTKRFGNSTSTNTNGQVGPGSYEVKPDFKKKKQKKIAVPKQIDRFPELLNKKKVEEPGPGSYEPRNTMEDKLIYKIQRGYRGQFGSTEIRSKEQEDEQTPGPADYDPKKVEDEKDSLSVFKSSSKRKGLQNKNNIPAPGLYNTNLYDISNRVIKEEEEDPDLIIKKPGFGVGETRFKDAPKRQQQFEDDDIIKQIQEKHKEEKKKKMLKNSPAFKNSEMRFKDGKKDNPGPGSYYDGQEDQWNKRTYNILFADI